MADISTTNLIDSIVVGTQRNVFTLPYAVCETAAATAAKTVTCDNFVLATGAMIVVKFAFHHTASTMSLNVNNTGNKTVYYNGANVNSGKVTAYNVYTFIYDGTNFRILGVNTNTDTKVSSTNSNSKLFLVGTTTQTSAGQTGYSNAGCYASGGALYSEGTKVALTGHTHDEYADSIHTHLSEISISAAEVSNLTAFASRGGTLYITGRMFVIEQYTNGTLLKLNLADDIIENSVASGRFFTDFVLPVANNNGDTVNAIFSINASIDINAGGAKEFTFILTNFNPEAVNSVSDGGRTIVANCIPISWNQTTPYYSAYAEYSHTHDNYALSTHTHTYSDVGAASSSHTHTYSDVGAASSKHTHTYSQVGAASSAHTHTSQNYAVNYGTCSTASGTSTKTVIITGITSTPSNGTRITVRFANANNATTPTLRVDNGSTTGTARSIKSPSSNLKWCAGAIIDFVYYSAAWYMMSPTPTAYYTTSTTTASGGTAS